MAGSATRRMQFITLERAVSNDFNRLQAFLQAEIAEVLRYVFDVQTSEDNAGGLEAVGTSVTNPLRGVILAGLRCRPEIGTTNLFIEPGVALLVDPDAVPDTDDSPMKWIKDDGVTVAGTLTMPAAAGSTRIDVVECRRVAVVEETQSRDVFNETTGNFTASLENKVIGYELEYRIREGTAGGGFAGLGTASGWLPLMVYAIPAGATTWNDVTLMWDVRPLASDFVEGPFNISQPYPIRGGRRQYAIMNKPAGANPFQFNGFIDSSYEGRKIGGEIGASSVFAAGYLDMSNWREPGWAPAADVMTYIYCMTPFNLPRWAQYTSVASGQRLPGPFRGILVQSEIACEFDGTPQAVVALPTAVALGGSSQAGRCICCQPYIAALTNLTGFVMEDGWVMFDTVGNIVLAATAGGATAITTFTMVDDTHVPRIATAFRGTVHRNLAAMTSSPEGGYHLSYVLNPLDATVATGDVRASNIVMDNVADNVFPVELTLRSQYPYGTAADGRGTFKHQIVANSAPTVNSTTFYFEGVKLAL